MASQAFRLTGFRPNPAGIIGVWKSEGMQDALLDLVVDKIDEANDAARLHGPHDFPLYDGGVDVLDRTAVGYVSTRGRLGAVEQAAHQTLDEINH